MMVGIDAVSKMCLWKLRKDEIPESEYGLSGNDQKDYVCVEMLKVQWVNVKKHHFSYDDIPRGETDAWKVVSFNNGEKVVHGIFKSLKISAP